MKRYSILYFILFLFCCCNSTIKHENAVTNVDAGNSSVEAQMVSICDTAKPGVYMEIGKQVIPISVETLGVTVINNTDKDVELGNIYYIEKREEDKWNRIALDRDTFGNIIAYDLVGYSLKPNSFIKKTYSLLKCAYNYRAGKYRIVIPYTPNRVYREMSSEFTVAER